MRLISALLAPHSMRHPPKGLITLPAWLLVHTEFQKRSFELKSGPEKLPRATAAAKQNDITNR